LVVAIQVEIFILCIGLSEEMYEEGYTNIHNIDFSQICIKSMEEKNRVKFPQMTCNILEINIILLDRQMDILDMKDIKNGEFQVVVDKGTLDSILVII